MLRMNNLIRQLTMMTMATILVTTEMLANCWGLCGQAGRCPTHPPSEVQAPVPELWICCLTWQKGFLAVVKLQWEDRMVSIFWIILVGNNHKGPSKWNSKTEGVCLQRQQVCIAPTLLPKAHRHLLPLKTERSATRECGQLLPCFPENKT